MYSLQACYSKFPTLKPKQGSPVDPNENTLDPILDFVYHSYAFLIYTYKRQGRKMSCGHKVGEWNTIRLWNLALQKWEMHYCKHVYWTECALISAIVQFTLHWACCQASLVSEANSCLSNYQGKQESFWIC